MEFSWDESWQKLDEILQKDLPFSEAWSEFVDFHSQVKDKPYWDALRRIDANEAEEGVAGWLNGLPVNEPLPDTLKALWFGIVTLYDERSGREVYAYYVHGTDNYDASDVHWASEPTYDPEDKYCISEAINSVRGYIKDDERDFVFLDWIFPLAYTAFLLRDIFKHHLDRALFLASREQLHAAVGYDNGDFIHLRSIN